MRSALAAVSFAFAAMLARPASAEDASFGGSIRGYGGVLSADSTLGVSPGRDEPDPLRNVDLQAKGIRSAGGVGSSLFVAINDVRFGFDASVFFSDAYRLENAPLANGFTASARTAFTADLDVFVGRMFTVGAVRPYIDLRIGASVLQQSIRLEHPAFGFVGATDYNAVRFMFGPRTGVLVPLAGPFYLDVGSEVSLLGYSRLVGFAGIAIKLGTDDVARNMKSRR